MKAFGPKRLPFIKNIINTFADYTKENNHGNTRLDYTISYQHIHCNSSKFLSSNF